MYMCVRTLLEHKLSTLEPWMPSIKAGQCLHISFPVHLPEILKISFDRRSGVHALRACLLYVERRTELTTTV